MENNIISRAEHDEFKRRMEDENNRQNHRIDALEKTVEQIHALTTAVEKLAVNMERMAAELGKQGERLETLESRDGEMWRKVIGYILTAIASAGTAFLFAKLG